MIWGPFVLALALGIIVSAGLYFAYLWPQVEPDDEVVDAASAGTASTAPDRSDSRTDEKSGAEATAEPASDEPSNNASESESSPA